MKLHKAIENPFQRKYVSSSDYHNKKIFRWTEESIKWYLEAEENTLFYKKVIGNIKEYFYDVKTALDIGCGLGGISIALAKEDIYVTALDISALAIEILKQRVEQYKLNNIKVINDDFKKITIKEKYDIVIVSYVMGLISTENLDKLLSLTNKYLVFVLPTEGFKNDFSIQELYKRINRDLFTLKQRTHMDVIRILKEKDIRYEVKFFEAQFNQPICSIEGGLKFIKYYFKISENYEKDIMKWLNEKIRVNHNGLYIPSFRKSSIIVLKK